MQVFTGETPGAAIRAIWSHDVANDQPGSKLAQASFTVTAADGWQGGDGGGPCASHTLALAIGHAPPLAPALLTLGLGTDVGLRTPVQIVLGS
jgi:hypothetical protein